MGGYDLSQLNVVVAEDSEFMRKILVAMLKAIGVPSVRLCEDGASALDQLAERPADLVIADWNMLPMPGIELVKTLRRQAVSPCPDVPIIMVTGHTELDRVMEARKAGISGYLRKPISAQMLYDRIVQLIENPTPELRDWGNVGAPVEPDTAPADEDESWVVG